MKAREFLVCPIISTMETSPSSWPLIRMPDAKCRVISLSPTTSHPSSCLNTTNGQRLLVNCFTPYPKFSPQYLPSLQTKQIPLTLDLKLNMALTLIWLQIMWLPLIHLVLNHVVTTNSCGFVIISLAQRYSYAF